MFTVSTLCWNLDALCLRGRSRRTTVDEEQLMDLDLGKPLHDRLLWRRLRVLINHIHPLRGSLAIRGDDLGLLASPTSGLRGGPCDGLDTCKIAFHIAMSL